jgi:hypothetical protein
MLCDCIKAFTALVGLIGPVVRRFGARRVDALYRRRRAGVETPACRFEMDSLGPDDGFKLPNENSGTLPFIIEALLPADGDVQGDFAYAA